jgi:magnesium and cobalt transporter
VNARLGLKIPAEEARTIGGYVAEALGRVPEQGDAVKHDEVRLVVDRVKANRVLQVRVEGVTSSR